jgi:23S rRNA (uracil1939-C5)-methyltransferase
MEFSFGGQAGMGLQLGLHPRDNYRDVFNLEECYLTEERVSRVAQAVRAFFASGGEIPYHPVVHTGFLRFVVVRIGHRTGDLLVNLVTADGPWPRTQEFGDYLRTACPDVTTALWTINSTRANIADGSIQTIYFGSGNLHERIGPFEFEIAPTGFFQTNSRQAERLFERVAAGAGEGGEILDLYSGAGAISLFLSQRAEQVVGVELHEASVEAAKRNAARNHVGNCEFIAADALVYLREKAAQGTLPPTVVLDPPRAGLHPRAVRTLIETQPRRIVYVSCNPPAFARDWETMRGVYRLTHLAAVDMFPHTPHIEAVACLELREDHS